jgi:MFS superfamily sulfate permease-like transporter
LARLGQWFRAVSPAVIHGMLSGIGVLILSSQIHVLVDDRPRENGLKNLLSIPEAVWKGLPLPAWEPAPERRVRIAMLQRFGDLHERQGEIESHVARVVSKHGSAAQHAREADSLAPFVPLQRQLAQDLIAARKEIESSPLAATGNAKAAGLATALVDANRKLDFALADLVAHDVEKVERSLAAASKSLSGVLANLKSHDWAAKVGLASIAIIFLWQSLAPKRFKLIPGPLLAVVFATLAAWLFSLPVLYVEVPARLHEGLTFPSLNVFQDVPLRELATAGLMMAIIASAETLLCAAAVDQMHSGPRTHYDRELAAQGVGNFLCGLVGALPMTGVIVRSAANVQAGATSRLSAILHGLWLLIFVVALSSLLRLIPTAALAGILVYTGFKLIDWKGFLALWRESRSEALIFLTTLVVIVVEDLLMGVVTGVILSAVKLLLTFSRLNVRVAPLAGGHDYETRRSLELEGAATFLRLPILAAKLEEIPLDAEVVVDHDRLEYIDHACLDLLTSWSRQCEAAGGRLEIDWSRLHDKLRGEWRHGALQHAESAKHHSAA